MRVFSFILTDDGEYILTQIYEVLPCNPGTDSDQSFAAPKCTHLTWVESLIFCEKENQEPYY